MSVFALATTTLAPAFPPAPVASAFVALVKEAAGDGQYLVEIVAYKGGEARSGGLAGLAEIALADLPKNSGVDVGQVTLTYADRHWIGGPDALTSADYGSIAEAVSAAADYGSIA